MQRQLEEAGALPTSDPSDPPRHPALLVEASDSVLALAAKARGATARGAQRRWLAQLRLTGWALSLPPSDRHDRYPPRPFFRPPLLIVVVRRAAEWDRLLTDVTAGHAGDYAGAALELNMRAVRARLSEHQLELSHAVARERAAVSAAEQKVAAATGELRAAEAKVSKLLESARRHIADVKSRAFMELKRLLPTSPLVTQILAAVGILFGERKAGSKTALTLLEDVKFKEKLTHFLDDRLPEAGAIMRLLPIIEDKNFSPAVMADNIDTVNCRAAAALGMWVHAVYDHYVSSQDLDAKKKQLTAAAETHRGAQKSLSLTLQALESLVGGQLPSDLESPTPVVLPAPRRSLQLPWAGVAAVT
jgi:hypothetical protein